MKAEPKSTPPLPAQQKRENRKKISSSSKWLWVGQTSMDATETIISRAPQEAVVGQERRLSGS